MPRVCVVGGGTAGQEAAREATRNGAEVTVIERSEAPEPPWKEWPPLITPCATRREPRPGCYGPGSPPGAEILTSEALSAGPGSVLVRGGARIKFDRLVVAKGTQAERPSIRGLGKPGSYILDCARRYSELGSALGSLSAIVVHGEGRRSLEVADRVCGSGRKVLVALRSWSHGEPSPRVMDVIRSVAGERGVSIAHGEVTKAVGSGRVEAALVGREVVSCDALVTVPRRVPNPLLSDCRVGPKGGILVDATLQASDPCTFAAGGSAEMASGPRPPLHLCDDPGVSGRVAGANATGSHLEMRPSTAMETRVFGLRWTRVVSGNTAPNPRRTETSFIGHSWGPYGACTIAFDRDSGMVLSIDSVEEERATPTLSPDITTGRVSLKTLAYRSSDISPVSETARMGVAAWSRS